MASERALAYVIDGSAADVGGSITRREIEDATLKITCMETREDKDQVRFDLGRSDPPYQSGERRELWLFEVTKARSP